MTATDEICARLDELGVEYDTYDLPNGEHGLSWIDGNNIEWEAVQQGENFRIHALQLVTPEQAIAATVGAGTCHYIPEEMGFTWWDENDVEHYEENSASEDCGSASCDKCGNQMMVGDEGWFDGWDKITEWWEEDGSYHKGYVLEPIFEYCPHCGRRCVGLNREG